MIFNWVIFSLYFSTSLFILVTGILTSKKRLLVNGVLLIIATSLLIGYIERDFNSSWIIPVNLLVLGIWIIVFYTQSLREIKVVVRDYNKVRLQNATLKDEQKKANNRIHKPSIVLKSKAILPIKDICYIKSDGPYIEYYLLNRKNPETDRNTLKSITPFLLKNNFMQINRSVIVNKDNVDNITKNRLFLNSGISIPISKKYEVVI